MKKTTLATVAIALLPGIIRIGWQYYLKSCAPKISILDAEEGDVVTLKDKLLSTPLMFVESTDPTGITCSWFDKTNKINHKKYKYEKLMIINRAKEDI